MPPTRVQFSRPSSTSLALPTSPVKVKFEPLDDPSIIVTEEIQIKDEKFEDEEIMKFIEVPINFEEDTSIKSEPEEDCEEIFEVILEEEAFKCDLCPAIFSNKQKLQSHKRAHMQGFNCFKCKKHFKLRSYFEIHTCSFKCETCGKEFLRRDNLSQHVNYVHGKWNVEDLFTCDYCNKGFKYLKSLRCHMKQHMRDKPLVCNLCGEGFSVNNTYKQHMLTHSGKVPCKICGKKLKPSALYYHTKQMHETEKNFHCQKCPMRFKTRGDLTSHIATHEKKFVCGICERKFSTSFHLRQHLVTHINPEAFRCNICSVHFGRKDTLVNHLRKVHKKSQLECRVCIFKTMHEDELEAHVEEAHSEKKKIERQEKIAPKKLSVVKAAPKLTVVKAVPKVLPKVALKVAFTAPPKVPPKVTPKPSPTKAIKREEKFLPCAMCNEAFLGEKSLKIHQLKMHSKATNCELCGINFSSKREFVKHLKNVHENEN